MTCVTPWDKSAGILCYDDALRQASIYSHDNHHVWGTQYSSADHTIVLGMEPPMHPSKHARRTSDKLPVRVLTGPVVSKHLKPYLTSSQCHTAWHMMAADTVRGSLWVLYVDITARVSNLAEHAALHVMHALAVKASHVQDKQADGLYVVGGFGAMAQSKNNMSMVLCKGNMAGNKALVPFFWVTTRTPMV